LAEDLGRKSPNRVQMQSLGGDLGAKPQKPEECYVIGLKKNHLLREKTSPYIIIIIISSTHRFVSSHFCFKIKKMQSVGSRASEMVHDGSRS